MSLPQNSHFLLAILATMMLSSSLEVDAELTEESSSNGGGGSSSLDSSRSGDGSGSAEIIKKGYLQKGPETRGDASSSMISISFHPKSFKRRFFYLKQQVGHDGTSVGSLNLRE